MMKYRPLTFDDVLSMVAAGYHCEVRAAGNCAYRPAPHFIVVTEGDKQRGLHACEPCKLLCEEDPG